jgi:hypothetical protein
LDDREQLLEDVAIVIPVPLLGQLTAWLRQLFEEAVRWVKSNARSALPLLATGAQLVDGHLSEPGAERSLSPPLEVGKLSDKDHQNLLRQIIRFGGEAGDSTDPTSDQWQIDTMHAKPIGLVWLRSSKAVEQADRRHGQATVAPMAQLTSEEMIRGRSIDCTFLKHYFARFEAISQSAFRVENGRRRLAYGQSRWGRPR